MIYLWLLTPPLFMWIIFIASMLIEDNIDKIHKALIIPANGFLVFASVYNVVFNFTYGTILFLNLFRFNRRTFSERLIHILLHNTCWRYKFAYLVSFHLVEPWDYNHCNLRTDRSIAKAVKFKMRKY